MRKSLERATAFVVVVGVGLFFGARGVLAQFSGDDAEIPENPPTNWTTGWLGWPLLALGFVVAFGVIAYYAIKMVRLRYPARG